MKWFAGLLAIVILGGGASYVAVNREDCAMCESVASWFASPATASTVTAVSNPAASDSEIPACCMLPTADAAVAQAKSAKAQAAACEACEDCDKATASTDAKVTAASTDDMPACCATEGEAAVAKAEADTNAAEAVLNTPKTVSAAVAAATQRTAVDPATGSPEGVLRWSDWVAPADRQPFDLARFRATNQDGQPVELSSLVGQPIAMSFIFTRCPSPTMCPLIVTQMAKLQSELKAEGLDERVKLVLISYDPNFDSPARLKTYGSERGLVFNNHAMMLRPEAAQLADLVGELGVTLRFTQQGQVTHLIELILIDHQGRYVRDYQGKVWDNKLVLPDVKKLIEEQTAAAMR